MEAQTLSKWFYLGIVGVIIGIVMIIHAKGNNKSKTMENGYLLLILGLVGVIAEFTDFASVLLIFTIFSGVILLADKLFGSKQRLNPDNLPHYVHYSKEFFPVILIVWLLRSFLFEAYQIPSSSMRPDLIVGDFILVSKYDYGLRMPFTNKVVIPIHKVQRGDVIVFQDQTAPNRDLIKRVIGLPGDTISYANKRLSINGKALDYQGDGSYDYMNDAPDTVLVHNQRYIENLTGVKHPIITIEQVPPVIPEMVQDFPGKQNCEYNNDGFSCTVPAGHYFMMGDNRDNSLDSRYWGFVPNQAILGKAIYVWMNFRDLSRIGTKIQ
ncbi:MAG: signal peptidase [Pseudomonadota bacterium]|jgi:signal peptidase I